MVRRPFSSKSVVGQTSGNGKAEEEGGRLALEGGFGDRLAVLVDQREGNAEGLRGDFLPVALISKVSHREGPPAGRPRPTG